MGLRPSTTHSFLQRPDSHLPECAKSRRQLQKPNQHGPGVSARAASFGIWVPSQGEETALNKIDKDRSPLNVGYLAMTLLSVSNITWSLGVRDSKPHLSNRSFYNSSHQLSWPRSQERLHFPGCSRPWQHHQRTLATSGAWTAAVSAVWAVAPLNWERQNT